MSIFRFLGFSPSEYLSCLNSSLCDEILISFSQKHAQLCPYNSDFPPSNFHAYVQSLENIFALEIDKDILQNASSLFGSSFIAIFFVEGTTLNTRYGLWRSVLLCTPMS